jgi:parvulin-like peptidyl-prolyl isomerase
MRHVWLVCFLFGVLAWGQAKPPAAAPQKSPASAADDDDDKPVPPPAAAAAVASNDPVLTIKGLCPETSSKPGTGTGADCKTVLTREQFEKIARAIQPAMTPVVKRQLLSLYPRLLVMSHEAEVRGLDKEEYFQQMFLFARMQILTQQLTKRIQQEAAQIPEQDIADYYQKHLDSFTLYDLERILVPHVKQEPPPKEKLSEEAEKERQKNAEAEMTKLAEALRARAANGEEFAALQKEAFQAAGLKSNPPNASLGKVRRTSLPPGQEAVFDLPAGGVSQVFSDSSGHYIYKLDGKTMQPLNEVTPEIHNKLQSQRAKQVMDSIQAPFSTEINDAYFGPPLAPAPATEGGSIKSGPSKAN